MQICYSYVDVDYFVDRNTKRQPYFYVFVLQVWPGARERKISWGQTRRRDRDAEGVDGRGIPSHPTVGSGERCELPQQGPWRSVDAKRIWCILMPSGGRWLQRFTEFCSVSSNAELCKLHKHRQDT